MFGFQRHRALPALAVASLVLVMPACKREEPQIKEMTEKAAQADKLQQDIQKQGAEEQKKLQQAGVTDVRPNPETLQLSEEQKKALEERLKKEQDSSYRAILQEVLDKDKQIKDLNAKLGKLKSELPKPDLAKANDSHYGLAMRFLKKKGVSEAEAKKLISRVFIHDKLAPGFEVYHFYANGSYGTWVTQGKAKVSPTELDRQEKAKIEGERDEAIAANEKLQEEVLSLEDQRKKIEEDIAALNAEKAQLTEQVNGLQKLSEEQKGKLNSLHYLVGERRKLQQDGIIVVPVFAKDRMGPKATDKAFDRDLDLRSTDTIEIKAADAGVAKISKVNVIPGSLVKDEHYSLTISADKQTATIKILNKDRFLNDKVVFAVSE